MGNANKIYISKEIIIRDKNSKQRNILSNKINIEYIVKYSNIHKLNKSILKYTNHS